MLLNLLVKVNSKNVNRKLFIDFYVYSKKKINLLVLDQPLATKNKTYTGLLKIEVGIKVDLLT